MKRCHQLKAALNQNVAHVVSILHMLLKRENKELQGNVTDDLTVGRGVDSVSLSDQVHR